MHILSGSSDPRLGDTCVGTCTESSYLLWLKGGECGGLQGTLVYHIPDSSFKIKEYCIFRQYQSYGVGEYYTKNIAFGLGRDI